MPAGLPFPSDSVSPDPREGLRGEAAHRTGRSRLLRGRRRTAASVVAVTLLAGGLPLLAAAPASAIEVPPGDFTKSFSIQTNGPASDIGFGDYYSASGGGNTNHQLSLFVPCSWPATLPISLDLYSAPVNTSTTYPGYNTYEEPIGTGDPTTFTFSNPAGGQIATKTYQPINAAADSYDRLATLPAPVACGKYTLVDTTAGDDQNGWRLRFGYDNDGDPTNSPPANYDNPDGVVGTDDELQVGLTRTTYQHDLGGNQCLTLYQYVVPGKAAITFNNFDMDGNGTVRYYAPSATYDPAGATGGVAGTVSGSTVWNGSNNLTRVGDTVSASQAPDPKNAAQVETGWWKVVTCLNNHNQFIQEGQTGEPAFFNQPPTPSMTLAKTDNQTIYDPSQTVSYTLTATNNATGVNAGAATKASIVDTLPAGALATACAPALGTDTCVIAADKKSVTLTLNGAIAAGGNRTATVTMTAPPKPAPATITNTAVLSYQDSYGNPFAPITATDVDNVSNADLTITKSHTGSFTVGVNGSYTLNVANGGATLARGVTVVDTLPAGLTYVSSAGTGWTCNGAAAPKVTCTYAPALANAASAPPLTITVAVDAAAFPTQTNSAVVSTSSVESNVNNNTATDVTTVTAASIGDRVFTDTNGNGLQDAGEAGLGGVTVQLLANDQTTVLQTVTTATTGTVGSYAFTKLAAGTFYVRFTAPTGQTFTLPAVGTDRTIDSDPSRTTGTTPAITLAAGAANTTVDAGLVAASSIGDLVYDDADGSGAFTAGDTGLGGLTVLLQQNGTTVASTTTATTGTVGSYLFSNVLPGTYTVVVATPAGFATSGTVLSPRTVTIAPGGNVNDLAEDFGFQRTTGSIGDTVYLDANGNGVQEAGDNPFTGGGVTLTLRKGGVQVGQPIVVGANGTYSFPNLTPGTYTVTATTVPTGYKLTSTNPITVTVTDGAAITTADVGLQQVSSVIGDTVFADVNGNGTQDAGEGGVNGVTLTLFAADGTTQVGQPTTTATVGGVAGQYSFTGLAAGTYFVKVTPPAGFAATTTTPLKVVLGAATTFPTADFGLRANGSIGDTVYSDVNGDGQQDNGDPGLAGAKVSLYQADGTTLIATQTTLAGGAYSFTNLATGTYVVKVVGPTGYVQTSTPATYTTTLTATANMVTTDDFGLQERDASIGDTVYNDADGDGVQDNGETGLLGATVTLYDAATGNAITSQVTPASGAYSFTGLARGTYLVRVVGPTGYVQTSTDPVSKTATYSTTLTAGQAVVTDDFGLQEQDAVLGDSVFTDLNGNGTLDGADAGRNGVTVQLFAGTTATGTALKTTVTATVGGVAGSYSFTGLPKGTYTVQVVAPAGFGVSTAPTFTTTLGAGAKVLTDDFGVQQRNASIGDLAFADAAGDGAATGDTGLDGVTVTLTGAGPDGVLGNADDVPLGTRTTAGGGAYSFQNLAAGTYRVTFTTPAGRYATTPVTFDRTVTAGQAVTDADAGFALTASIGDLVFNDVNGDGLQAGDAGLAGATVTLSQGGTLLQTSPVTTTSGAYSFTGLKAGTYSVAVQLPAGYVGTTPSPVTVTLNAGQTDPARDFGAQRRDSALNGTVYDDLDGGGTKDAGEGGVTGAKVTLVGAGPDGVFGNADDLTFPVITTTATGAYSFPTLPAGTYRITTTPASGYAATTPGVVTVTLPVATTTTTNFGEILSTGVIGDLVFNDANGDKTQDNGETGKGGVLVTLRQTGQLDRTTTTATTGTVGSYSFTGLAAGTYTVLVSAPAGYGVTTVTSYTTTLAAGQSVLTDDFGVQEQDATIGDTVYSDLNGNGQQDAGELGINNVTVTLFNGATQVAQQVTTGSGPTAGTYSFTNLPAGTYTVTATLPTGYRFVNPATGSTQVTIGAGGTVTSADFGLQPTAASIGDTVYNDLNGNGLQDAGEPGIQGVVVTLTQTGATRTTDGNGNYSFTGLPAGTYTVTLPTPAGFVATGPKQSGVSTTLTATQSDPDEDFGFQQRNTVVNGTVFNDVNADGSRTGDAGLAGATVTLTNTTTGVVVATSPVTGPTGAYSFTGLPAGSYTVTVTLPTGFTATTAASVPVTPAAGATSTTDFGARRTDGTIGDTVYRDDNGNGVQDPGEPGLDGRTVTLFDANGKILGTKVTATVGGVAGQYTFSGLVAGSYSVSVDVPTGSTAITPLPKAVTLTDGNPVTSADLGLQQRTASIGDTVFVDTNANGVQDNGEVGLNGAVVTLLDSKGATLATTTTTTTTTTVGTLLGQYSFPGLAPGTYSVVLSQPTGYARTTPLTVPVTLTSNQQFVTADFGQQQLAGSLGDTVYNDANANGQQDAGELGIPNLTVTLTPNGGAAVTTTTSQNGVYGFTGLAAGTYTVSVATPTGYAATGPKTSPFTETITATQSDQTIDFGFQERDGVLTGTVYNDADNNSAKGATEGGVQGTVVTLTDATGKPVGQPFTTGPDGLYSFSGLVPGDYTITTTPATGYLPTTPVTRTATIPAGSPVGTPPATVNVNFGEILATGSIGDTVFKDRNGNGTQQAGETGLDGLTVTLTNSKNVSVTTTTKNGGQYSFTGLVADTYTVSTSLQPGFVATSSPQSVVLTAGQARTDVDLGQQERDAVIGDTVFVDANANGVQDNGEGGLNGQTLTLTNTATNATATATTQTVGGVTGQYAFTGLAAGTYTVTLAQPAGYQATTPLVTTTITLAAGATYLDADFGQTPTGGSIGDLVYNDVNGNGVQDAGELGLPGLVVTLSQSGQPDRTTKTGANGDYTFGTLITGTYTVTVAAPTGYVGTGPSVSPATVVLTGPQTRTDVDFGLQERDGVVNGIVYDDANGDQAQGPGEKGLAGATVTLFQGTTQVGQPVTTTDGTYSFTGLTLGQYRVVVTPAPSYAATTPASVTVTTTATTPGTATFGEQRSTGTLNGTVYDDSNGNATIDQGEAGLSAQVVVTTPGPNGTTTTVATLVTDPATGAYSLAGLQPGTYTITSTPTAGQRATTPTSVTVTLAVDGTVTTDFGRQLTNSVLSGTVFGDTSDNGVLDGTETGIAGGVVTITDLGPDGKVGGGDDTPVGQPFTTTATGSYQTTGLPPGTYQVAVTPPAGYVGTSPSPVVVTLGETKTVTTDFGVLESDGVIGDLVFGDTNGNGVQDAGETGISGVTVTLTTPGQPPVVVKTDGNGAYAFTNLPAGGYTVTVTPPAGSTATGTGAARGVQLGAGETNNTVDFGVALDAARISGTVFDDLDKDGTLATSGEPGRDGVTVTLTGGAIPAGSPLVTTTAGGGLYSFGALPAGTYTVTLTTPAGVTTTSPVTVTKPLTTGQQLTGLDFGLGLGTIGDTVFGDTSGNGVQDGAETGVAGVTVTLTKGGTTVATTKTDANGAYAFTDLLAGDYTVTVTAPTGQVVTNGATRSVTLAAGGTDLTSDFGLGTPAAPNSAPAFTSDPTNTKQAVTTGSPLTPLKATDADKDPLTYKATSALPPGVTALNPDGTFAGAPSTPGTYTVTATVTDGKGGTDTTTITITVTDPAKAPKAVDDTVTVPSGSVVVIDPRTNDTGNGLTVTGNTDPAHGTVTCTTTSCRYEPAAGYVGPDAFTYTITDANGLTATATVDVTVTNTPPAFTAAPTNTAQTVTLGGTPVPVAATDANGDKLTYTAPAGSLPPGLALGTDGTFTGTATTPGTYSVTVTVTDTHAATATTTLVITVPADQAPVFTSASGNTSQTIPLGGTPAPVTATDPDTGQTLTYTETGALPPGIALGTDGTFTGTATATGTYPVTVTVTDPYGKTDTTTLTITVVPAGDRAPVATDDSVTTPYGTPATTAVLANDSDPDKDPLNVQSVTQPKHGTVTCTASTCTYTPADGYSGPDSYTYVVSDGRGLTATGTVTVTVGAQPNGAPVFDGTTNNTSQTVVTPSPLQPVTATDPNGDPLTYTVTSGTLPTGVTLNPDGTFTGIPPVGTSTVVITVKDPSGLTDTTTLTITVSGAAKGSPPVAKPDTATTKASTPVTTPVLANDTDPDAGTTLSVSGVTQPTHGTVTCTATDCTYTPDPGYTGSDSYTYTVTDGDGNFATSTVTVSVTNSPPTFDGTSGNTSQTVPVGGTPSPLSATDPDTGQTLTYTTTSPLPAGLTLDPDGTFSGQATTPGTTTVVVTVSDGHGGTDSTTLVITVVGAINSPPVATNDTATTPSGTPVSIPVLKNDTDPNGDPLTLASFSQGAHGTVTCTGAGVCTYTPAIGFTGTDSFTYVVSDGKGGQTTGTVTVTVTAANAAPVAVPDTATTAEDTPITFDPRMNDSDPDGNPLTIVSTTKPAHGTVVCTTTSCTYTPVKNYDGPDSFTYTVSDGHGGTATTTVTLNVTPVNDKPVATPDKAQTNSGTAVQIPVTRNDTDPDAGDVLTVVSNTQPKHGTVTCVAGGVCTYTPATGFTGTDTFTYTVTDGHGATATTTVTVVVVNRAPVAVPDSATALAGNPVIIPVLDNDTDPDGDVLTVIAHGNPAHGTVACTPAGCTYLPTAGYAGPDSFTYTVSDGHGHRSTSTVTVTVSSGGGGGSGNGGGTGGTGNGGSGGSGGSGGGNGLPFTGAPVLQELGWALGLMAFGLMLLIAGARPRRRRS